MKAAVLTTLLVVLSLGLFAQVGINNDDSDPDGSAMLDVKSTDKGMLVPRMTTAQRTAISSPATGLLVFDSTTGGFWFYNGAVWEDLSSTIGSTGPTGPQGETGPQGPTGATGADGTSCSVSDNGNGTATMSCEDGTAVVFFNDTAAITELANQVAFLQTRAEPMKVFVSSTTHQGDLGGLAGADSTCQGLAGAAGLSGTYRAWLSDNSGSPLTRFTQSPVPYVLVNGTQVAYDWSDLVDGTNLDANIDLDENGMAQSVYVWTATSQTGGLKNPNYTCAEWTTNLNDQRAAIGRIDGCCSPNDWTDATGGSFCNNLHRLYCFEQ